MFYSADKLLDDNGDKIENDFDLKVYAVVPRLIWVTPVQILGGNYFADAILPFAKQEISFNLIGGKVDDSKSGIGDLCVEPFGISWHGQKHDAAVAVGGYAPTGAFDEDNMASPGHDMWTAMLTGGSTYYFDADKTWSASILARYEKHGEKREMEYTPGDDFHFEWGLGKTVAKTLDLGVAGYCYWQVTEDNDNPMGDDGKSRVFAVGPEASIFIPAHVLAISLRGEWEFEARNQTEGAIGVLTLTKGF